MTTILPQQIPTTLADVDLTPRGKVYPSPTAWNDQLFYQLIPDRFSDGQEATRDCATPDNHSQYAVKDKAAWMDAGMRFVGGTIAGIQSKLDYLQTLGVTTLWVNPPWRQRPDLETYHGYGIQNFLDIDPRFGTRQDLRDLVDAAHARGMYVILDVIYNHSGNNWFYTSEDGTPHDTMAYRHSPPHPFGGWRSGTGESIPKPLTTDDGVWPKEFQNLAFYTRAGSIGQWETADWEDPQSAEVEFRRGDFFDLKDFNLDNDEAMRALARAYQYWIAVTDCDGFRMDAVKHVSAEHSQKFCSAIRDYAQSIGKDNFFLTGEITSGSLASAYIDLLGNNIDTLLSIVKYPNALTAFAKGLSHPNDFLALYDPGSMEGLVRQAGRYLVNVLDDHDMSSRGEKARFAAGARDMPNRHQQVAHVVGVQLTTPGIPAIYYGTEQALDGSEAYHDYEIEPRRFGEDRYIRESMFGGEFGAFGTEGCHFFNQQHPTYVRISAIARLRNRQDTIGLALRRGRFFPRETTFLEYGFAIHGPGELTAWSRMFLETEVLMVLNPHGLEGRAAAITVDARLHPEGTTMRYLYRGDWSDATLENPPNDKTVTVQEREGRSVVEIDLPPSGMAILS